jgi:glutamate synthase (NADPH/NADH) small chain
VGTSHRQGAAHVLSLELMPRPPDQRREDNPWPAWPLVYRTSSSHEEGGERDFGVMTKRVLSDEHGKVVGIEAVRVELVSGQFKEVAGSETRIPADLVLLAMGFVGPITDGIVTQLGVALDKRGNVSTNRGATSVTGVFAAGDMARGQSLVVWAIAEGRRVAEAVDRYLEQQNGVAKGA